MSSKVTSSEYQHAKETHEKTQDLIITIV